MSSKHFAVLNTISRTGEPSQSFRAKIRETEQFEFEPYQSYARDNTF